MKGADSWLLAEWKPSVGGFRPANDYLNALWRALKDAPTTTRTDFQKIENQLKR